MIHRHNMFCIYIDLKYMTIFVTNAQDKYTNICNFPTNTIVNCE